MPFTPSLSSAQGWLARHGISLAVLLGTALLAFSLRLAIFDRFLPYVDYSDEVVYVALADHVRGVSDQSGLIALYGTIAPLYVTFVEGVLNVHDWLSPRDWQIPADYLYALRVISVLFGISTAVLLADTARRLAGALAGALAGVLWSLSPHIAQHDILALPDSPLYFCGALVLWASVRAYQARSYAWLFVSLVASIAMIYLKIWVITAVLPFLCLLGAWMWQAHRQGEKQAWRWLAVYALVAGVGALSLLSMSENIATRTPRVPERMWDIERIMNNFGHVFISLGRHPEDAVPVALLGIGAGIIAWAWAYRHGLRRVELGVLGVFVLYVLVSMPLTSLVSFVITDNRLRHIFQLSLVATLVWAVAIQQVAWVLSARGGRVAVLVPFLVGGVAIAHSLNIHLRLNANLIENFAKTHVITRTVNWADENLPFEGDSLVLLPLESSTATLWNHYWGAYNGSRHRAWYNDPIERIVNSTPSAYLAQNMRYYIVASDVLSQRREAHDAFIAHGNAQLIKTFAPAEGFYHGITTFRTTPEMTVFVYRFGAPEYALEGVWGEQIALLGLDGFAPEREYTADEVLTLRFFWQAQRQPSANYSVFVHLYPADHNDLLAQADGAPALRASALWDDPQEVLISEAFSLSLPPDLPSGAYTLAIGLYDYQTFARLTLPDGADALRLPLVVR